MKYIFLKYTPIYLFGVLFLLASIVTADVSRLTQFNSDYSTTLKFNIKPLPQDDFDLRLSILGMKSADSVLAIVTRNGSGLKSSYSDIPYIYASKIIRSLYNFLAPESGRVAYLEYTISSLDESSNAIQDISLTLPEDFHNGEQYELACKSLIDHKMIVFRRSSQKFHNQNYEEPPTILLPRGCISPTGVVRVSIENSSVNNNFPVQLYASIFRATAWSKNIDLPNHSSLDLYLPKMDYLPGDKMDIHAHASNNISLASLEIVRVGKENQVVKRIENIKLESQKISPYSYRDGLGWPTAISFRLPINLRSGYYVAVLRQGEESSMYPFIVNPHQSSQAEVAIIASTNTWQAYNRWGGGSFYSNTIGTKYLGTDYARTISDQRPIDQGNLLAAPLHTEHLFNMEKQIPMWMELNGMKYSVYSENQLHSNKNLLNKYKIIILPSHPEYFSVEMYDALMQYINNGGNVISLGGNSVYSRVIRHADQMEKHDNGRLNDLSSDFGGFWAMHLGRSPASLLGVEYDARDYGTYAPYKVLHPDNPIFYGTGLKKDELFGFGASGHEMDVVTRHSPPNVVVLAKGQNPKGYGADMVIFDTPSGGKVFSVGSISFVNGLVRDPNLGKIVRNAIEIMQSSPAH